MIFDEGAAVASRVEIGAQAHAGPIQRRHIARRLAIKPQQVLQHAPEARTQQVAPLGEQPAQVGAGIFQSAIAQRHRERHLRCLGRHAEVPEQRRQVRIGLLVVNDETGVHHDRTGRPRHIDRIAVTAEAIGLLVHGHVMATRQQPGGAHAGNPGADHGNVQRWVIARHRSPLAVTVHIRG